MIENGITDGINKFYFILKLSLYFWALSLLGGIVLGVAPAFLACMSIYQEVEWQHKEITWGELVKLFKANFVSANQLLALYLGLGVFLFLSLWSSSQLTGMIFLMIDFILFFLLIVVSLAFLLAISLVTYYDISLWNLLKLSLLLFFKEFKAVISLIVFFVVFFIVIAKMPAFIFFLAPGSLSVFISRLGGKIEASLVLN